jgi:hypothetical protein
MSTLLYGTAMSTKLSNPNTERQRVLSWQAQIIVHPALTARSFVITLPQDACLIQRSRNRNDAKLLVKPSHEILPLVPKQIPSL